MLPLPFRRSSGYPEHFERAPRCVDDLFDRPMLTATRTLELFSRVNSLSLS